MMGSSPQHGTSLQMPSKEELDVEEEMTNLLIREKMLHFKLSNRGLRSVPAVVMATPGLKSIDLGFNKLTVLPGDLIIKFAPTLRSLTLWNNLLVALPPEIVLCTNLTELKVGNNHIPILPEKLGSMQSLLKFDASGNRITELPRTLSHLQELTLLDLSRNKLPACEDDNLWTLTNVTKLSIAGNLLSKIPLAVACLTDLRILNAGANQITELEPDLVKLPYLEELHLADNLIRHLPGPCWRYATNLKTLDLCNNCLASLPNQLGYVTNLTFLGMTRNDRLAPRLIEAMNRGLPFLLQAMRDLTVEFEIEEDHVSAVARMHEERKQRRKVMMESLLSGNSGQNDGVERFYRELLALSVQGEEEEVEKARERLAKRMLNTHAQ
mmetsp:Transcript_19219/g.47141  ORF Transcript_19219/g.47141 Transcript_19219/m.47141 type:complete len:382 (+) Transcript_19219:141-1286(+)